VLYECLTGERAFQGEVYGDLIAAILEREADLDALPTSTPARLQGHQAARSPGEDGEAQAR